MQQPDPPDEIPSAPSSARLSPARLAAGTGSLLRAFAAEIVSSQDAKKIQICLEKLAKKPTKNSGDWLRQFLTTEFENFYKDQFLHSFPPGAKFLDRFADLKFLAAQQYPNLQESPETKYLKIESQDELPRFYEKPPPPVCDFCCRDARLPADKIPGGEILFTCDQHSTGPAGRHNPARKRAIRLARRIADREPAKSHWIRRWRNQVLSIQTTLRKTISSHDVEVRAALNQVADELIKELRPAPRWATFDLAMIPARHLAIQRLAAADRQTTMGWKCEISEIDRALDRVGAGAGVRETARLTGLHPSTVSRRARKAR